MPKIIELTVEIEIQRVSCPGVWLCQDGRVSLTVYALGTNYQTCLLPPVFPLLFKDVFYFRKRFQETCSLNNITCLLRDETIFCELVQWCEDCSIEECTTLAQYLGALNDVLFPPNMCSNDGVDLLMRRTKQFPGILSPKIEIATKVRIDEVFNNKYCDINKATPCHCTQYDMDIRQKQVCHSSQYHRNKCNSATRHSRSRSRSGSSRSCTSFKDPETHCKCLNNPRSRSPRTNSPRSVPRPSPVRSPCSPRTLRHRQYQVYNANVKGPANLSFNKEPSRDSSEFVEIRRRESELTQALSEERMHNKNLLESRFIENEINEIMRSKERNKNCSTIYKPKLKPCICEICRRYHELFHSELTRD